MKKKNDSEIYDRFKGKERSDIDRQRSENYFQRYIEM